MNTSLNQRAVALSSTMPRRVVCTPVPCTHVIVCRGIRSLNGERAPEATHRPAKGLSSSELYEQALEFARAELYDDARSIFEDLLTSQPSMCKAWVSWAQMEKRCHRINQLERWQRCRTVLQRGLQLNPTSSCLVQAWGLMELQRGNWLAAIMLLERSARLDDKCLPVLRWHPVITAKKTVGSRNSSARSRQEGSTTV